MEFGYVSGQPNDIGKKIMHWEKERKAENSFFLFFKPTNIVVPRKQEIIPRHPQHEIQTHMYNKRVKSTAPLLVVFGATGNFFFFF